MTTKRKYTISRLIDFSRLHEIYVLNHDALAEIGDITPKKSGVLIMDPRFDTRAETFILIAEQEDKIIGTISFTLDSQLGMHLDKWFKLEVDQIRKKQKGQLGTAWRFAIDHEHRHHTLLALDLIRAALDVGCQQNCSECLIVSTYRHIKVYQKIMVAEVVVKRKASLDDERMVDIAMLNINVNETRKRFSNH